MKVSRNSWHYRLHSFVFTFFNWEHYGPLPAIKGRRREHQPRSLCGYFWSTVFLTMLAPLLALLILIAALGISPFVAAFLGGEKVHDTYREIRPKKVKLDPKPNLVKEFVKARKQRVCPMITLTD